MQTSNKIFFNDSHVTSAIEVPGFVVARNIGVVRGISVRSRSIVGSFFGGLQTLFGGDITIYANLCEKARVEAYERMCENARQVGANGIICMRYDATDLMPGLTEVLCYGSAVLLQPQKPTSIDSL